MAKNCLTVSETLGNTKPGSSQDREKKEEKKSRIAASKKWTFTYFYGNEKEMSDCLDKIKKLGEYYVGEEICPTTQKKHLQGFVNFTKACRPIETIGIKSIHWEKMKGSIEQNYEYCGKEGKVHTNMAGPYKIIDPMEGLTPNKTQQQVLEWVNGPKDRRTINWICDDGNSGKTTVAFHICLKHNAIMLSGKGNDIKSGVASHVEKGRGLDIALFHFVRSQEQYISYEALECIKDGIFFNGKYESGMVKYNPPIVIVLANFPPELDKLTQDRWNVVDYRRLRTKKLDHEACGAQSSDEEEEVVRVTKTKYRCKSSEMSTHNQDIPH